MVLCLTFEWITWDLSSGLTDDKAIIITVNTLLYTSTILSLKKLIRLMTENKSNYQMIR